MKYVMYTSHETVNKVRCLHIHLLLNIDGRDAFQSGVEPQMFLHGQSGDRYNQPSFTRFKKKRQSKQNQNGSDMEYIAPRIKMIVTLNLLWSEFGKDKCEH